MYNKALHPIPDEGGVIRLEIKMKYLVALFVCTFLMSSVHAIYVGNATITEVRSGTWFGDKVTFKVEPAPIGSCTTNSALGHYLIDLSKPGAYAWFSMVVSAKKDKSTIQVWGTDSCLDINEESTIKVEELETISIN